jgi:hypothetical protein
MSIQTTADNSTLAEENKPLVPPLYVALGVVILLVVAGLFIWAAVWLAQNQAPAIEAVRDIFIIGLSLTSCLFAVVLVLMLVMIVRLVNMIEFEIKPILEKTNETIGVVRGTSVFVSRNVVTPVTRATSVLVGIRRGLKALFGDPSENLTD